LRFAKAIKPLKTAATPELRLVTIKNEGLSVFGMVNAEVARNWNKAGPVERESNWYHHIVLLDEDGMVYDFDFTIKPTIVPIDEYIERMFLEEPECEKPAFGEFCGGRENKLDGYSLESIDVWAALEQDDKAPKKKASLSEVLEDYRILF